VSAARPIRILTANLLGGRADPAALVDRIEELGVDVACVQELGRSVSEALARALPGGRLGPDDISRGLGIACRYPARVETFPLPKRDGWVARLAPESWDQLAEPVEIVNVHILGPHTWPYFPSPHTRAGQLRGLLEFLDRDPHTPRAVLGDFNSSPIWPLYRRMRARLADAVLQAERVGGVCAPTWPHVPRLGLSGLIRIDHCFVSGLTAVDARPVAIPGSDHLGLCVDVVPASRRDSTSSDELRQ
jgi:endonuclease/exonuclease/phosphatase (EEP) superfamily protein YafD